METDNVELIEQFLTDPHVVELDRNEFDVAFVALLYQVCKLAGRTLTEDQINLFTDEIYLDIVRRFSWIRSGELRFALEQGAKGFAGDVFDINYPALVKWITFYRDSPERREAVNRTRKRLEPAQLPAPELSDENRLKMRFEHLRDMAVIAWDIFSGNVPTRFADSRVFMLLPEEAFYYLQESGKLILTKEEKAALLTQVTKLVREFRQNDERSSGRISDSIFFVQAESEQTFLQTCARKFAVARYFNKLHLSKQSFSPE